MIRKFKNSDLPEVMKIWLNANIDAHAFIDADYWRKNFDMVKSLIPQADVYIFEKNGAIEGFVGVMDYYIAGIFVKKAYRASGVGTKLLNKVKSKTERLSLSVYAKNEPAIHFYESAGFHIETQGVDVDTNEIEYTMIWQR